MDWGIFMVAISVFGMAGLGLASIGMDDSEVSNDQPTVTPVSEAEHEDSFKKAA